MPPKKQDKTVAEIHDEIILLENKIKAVELKLVTDKEKLIALKQTEERIRSEMEARLRIEMEERIRQEQTEARLRIEMEERIRQEQTEERLRVEMEERIRQEQTEERLRVEIEARLRAEMEAGSTGSKPPPVPDDSKMSKISPYQILKTKFTKECSGWVILEKVYEAFVDVRPSLSKEEIVKFLLSKGYSKTAKMINDKQRYGITGLTLIDSDMISNVSTKRKTIPKAVKITLWNKFFGEDNAKGKCEVCQREIKMTEFDAGHIIAVTNGGSDNLDNLAPVCGTCNKSMGTQNLQDFKTVYFLPSSSPQDEGSPVPVSVDLLSF